MPLFFAFNASRTRGSASHTTRKRSCYRTTIQDLTHPNRSFLNQWLIVALGRLLWSLRWHPTKDGRIRRRRRREWRLQQRATKVGRERFVRHTKDAHLPILPNLSNTHGWLLVVVPWLNVFGACHRILSPPLVRQNKVTTKEFCIPIFVFCIHQYKYLPIAGMSVLLMPAQTQQKTNPMKYVSMHLLTETGSKGIKDSKTMKR